MNKISQTDEVNYLKIRSNVSNFVKECAEMYDDTDKLILDIAPQDHEGANPFFKKSKIETFDIDPNSEATYVADLCVKNAELIPSNHFDLILCTEVLEHTLQPFKAVEEIERLLKKKGLVFVSTPYNFRIHGPLPDCWRFTEYGLKELFKNFDIKKLTPLEDPDRFLMPTHYTLIAQKK